MHIAILGQPLSGKSTVFEALTGSISDPVGTGPALATVKVPDERLERLTAMFKPKKMVPADVTFLDVRNIGATFSKSEGLSQGYIDQLAKADALLLVVRAFSDNSVPHLDGSVDPWRDLQNMQLELSFTDQVFITKRLERIDAQISKVKPSERESMERDRQVLRRLLSGLENEQAIRDQEQDEEELKLTRHYQFLTAKPLMVILNIGEDQISAAPELEGRLAEHLKGSKMSGSAISASIERELVQLSGEDAAEFRESMSLSEPARDRTLRETYRLLGLMSFFTAGPDECRAWTIPAGTLAPRAAGAIHSDIERGFIRAEVVHYDDLMASGGLSEARQKGVLRREGKQYVMRDGDVVEFLFNV